MSIAANGAAAADVEPQVCYYQVELTGQDQQGRVFSEQASVEWSPELGKVLHSGRKLECGMVVSVRLLAWQGRNAAPLPYRVSRVVEATRISWIIYLEPLDDDEEDFGTSYR